MLVTVSAHFCKTDGRSLEGIQFCKIDGALLGGMQLGVLAKVLF